MPPPIVQLVFITLTALPGLSRADGTFNNLISPGERISVCGWMDIGVTINPASPGDRTNYGQLFQDRSNEPQLNQFGLQIERRVIAGVAGADGQLLMPADAFDWGFKIIGVYGSDARYIHMRGWGDHYGNGTLQANFLLADFQLHLPGFTDGGMELLVGRFPGIIGYEGTDARVNFFSSRDYITYFASPPNPLGVMTVTHLGNGFDLRAAIIQGTIMGFSDNNDSVSFLGGLTWTDKDTWVNLAVQIGPEAADNNHSLRHYNDLIVSRKLNAATTVVSQLNYIYDEADRSRSWGGAQYLTYAVTEDISVGLRGEIFRDEDGARVIQIGNNDDLMNIINGLPPRDPRTFGAGPATYLDITLGVNFRVKPWSRGISGFVIRPEIRYDRVLNDGPRPFNDSHDRDQITIGLDALLTF